MTNTRARAIIMALSTRATNNSECEGNDESKYKGGNTWAVVIPVCTLLAPTQDNNSSKEEGENKDECKSKHECQNEDSLCAGTIRIPVCCPPVLVLFLA